MRASLCFLTLVSGWLCVLHCCCIAADPFISGGITLLCNCIPLVEGGIATAAEWDAGRTIWTPAWMHCRDSLMTWWLMVSRSGEAKWLWSAASSCLMSTVWPGALQDVEQHEGELFSSLIWMEARGLSWGGEFPCWLFFSTSSCSFSSSTSLCSCSSFLISSSIWRSFSCRRLSFSESLPHDLLSVGHSSCRAVWPGDRASATLLSSMPRLDTLETIGDTGGLNFMFSVVTVVVSTTMLEGSWYNFSLSIRSVLVPETGKDLSFSAFLSSATCNHNRWSKNLLGFSTACESMWQDSITFISSRLAGKWSSLQLVWVRCGRTGAHEESSLKTLEQLFCASDVLLKRKGSADNRGIWTIIHSSISSFCAG